MTDTKNTKLEQLFRAVSVKDPKDSSLRKLREYPERDHCIQFLIAKLQACHRMAIKNEPWDSALERGCIQGCRILGALKAEAAIDILVKILDSVRENDELDMYDSTLLALAKIGPPVFEPVYAKYEEDQSDPDRASAWLDILSQIEVRDPRITKALQRFFSYNTVLALIYIGSYGDRELLPLVDRYVRSTARHLNEFEIYPRGLYARLRDPMVGAYIDSSEVLVRLREDIDFDHPEFGARVDALDDELLTTKDPWPSELPDEPEPFVRPSPKIGRNDSCPCGSGKKFKKCCGQPC